MSVSAFYVGDLAHTRLRPVAHELKYRLFQIYLDLDEAAGLAADMRLFGFNGPGLMSFHENDHGDGSTTPLKLQIEALVSAKGHASGGPVRVLCIPRILGHVFNPISTYFCHDRQGRLSAIVYEVNNTFGDRTAYVLPANSGGALTQSADKTMHVSPFMEMDHEYDFHVRVPGPTARIAVHVKRQGEVWLTASFAGRRREMSDEAILKTWISDPALTLKIVAAIHWEALKLWRKGLRFLPKPHGRVRIESAGGTKA